MVMFCGGVPTASDTVSSKKKKNSERYGQADVVVEPRSLLAVF
jgi:hypothetical protein